MSDGQSPKKAGNRQRTILIVVCVALAFILTALIAATVYAETLFGKIDGFSDETLSQDQINALLAETETKPADFAGVDVDLSKINWGSKPAIVDSGENILNFLVVGTDSRTGESEGLSDVCILVTVNKEEKTIYLSSFLRDMYVQIPEYFPHKFNTAFALGGMDVLHATLEENFGVTVDGSVSVGFEGFKEVVNAVGGVDIELTEDEVWYLDTHPWDSVSYAGVEFQVGMNHMNGDAALAYARVRGVNDAEGNGGDFGRTNRQRIVITKILEKAKSLSIGEMNTLLNELVSMVSTDLTNSEIVNYALDLFPLLSDCKIQSQQIPVEGSYYLGWVEQDGGMSVIIVDDFEANVDYLKGIMTD